MKYAAYNEYKPSGTDWLGNVPIHWNTSPLKYVANIKTGYAFSSDDFTDEGVPVLRISDITKEGKVDLSNAKFLPTEDAFAFKAVALKSGDIVMAMTGATIGKVGRYEFETPCLLNQRVCSFETIKNNCQKYLWHLLNADFYIKHIALTAFGGAQPNISDTQLLACDVPLPPLDEQQTIARFLDAKTAQIDALVAQKRQLIAMLKEKRSALIARTVTRGLPPEAAKAAGLEPNPEMKDSGVDWLGAVPKTWQVKRLGFMCSKIGSGKTPSGGAETYEDSGIVFLRSQNVYDEGLELADVAYINSAVDAEMENSRVKPLDVLLNITGASIGRSCLVPFGFPAANVNQHVCIVRLLDKTTSEYVAWVLKAPFIKSQIDAAQSGAAREGLNFDQLSKFLLALPETNERKEISKYIECETVKIDSLISRTETAIARLTEYRQALITSAVTGKIDVRGLA